jgi:hypothetical protein
LEGNWCLFEGAIIVSIFHSRKETKKNPKNKKLKKKKKPEKRIKKTCKKKTLIYEN